MMDKMVRINYLLDIYGCLLTEKQHTYIYDYYCENLSLTEISEVYKLSRQTIHDSIKRVEVILENYEAKLKLYEKMQTRKNFFAILRSSIAEGNVQQEVFNETLNKLENLDESSDENWLLKD